MSLSRYLGIGALFIGFTLAAAPGCSSDSTSNTGGSGGSTGGSGGSTGGSGGSTGGSGGATGGAGGSTFMDVAPCSSESDYMMATTITALPALKYSPACVKVKKGTAVKFMMDFASHPLEPSKKRGDTDNNPIKEMTAGTEASFTFDKAGFFGFFCNFHGPADDGKNMAGVVWVTE